MKINEITRDTQAIECDCGGYAEQVKPTKEEMTKHGCGRMIGCCTRVFVCKICSTRIPGSSPAPEYD